LRKEIQRLAEENLSAVRTQKDLEFVIKRISELRGKMLADISMSSKSRIYNMQWMEYIELRNLLDVLEISSRSAMMRSESRGVHFREDCPYTDNDKWLKTIVFKNESGTPKLYLETLVITKIKPPLGCTEYKAFIRSICEKFRREEL
jgi:succinate dehydrogenase/fumarate reductase flavoprotein subunit